MAAVLSTRQNTAGTARHRSYLVYAAVAVAVAIFFVWGFARIGVCWGRYGWLGSLACHSHWGVGAALLFGIGAFVWLTAELSIAHQPSIEPGSYRRTRAAFQGYRQLETREFRHVVAALVILVISLCAFLSMVLFSRVRF